MCMHFRAMQCLAKAMLLNLELFSRVQWKGLHFLTFLHLDRTNLSPFQVIKIIQFYSRDVSV